MYESALLMQNCTYNSLSCPDIQVKKKSYSEFKKRLSHVTMYIYSPCCMPLTPILHVEFSPYRPVNLRVNGIFNLCNKHVIIKQSFAKLLTDESGGGGR